MADISLEKGLSTVSQTSEIGSSVVVQPSHVQFEALLDGINKMSEDTSESPSGDWSGSGGSTGKAMTTSGGQATASTRDDAIANLPAPVVMQKELEKHIMQEVRKLRQQAKSVSRMSRPGAAYRLNQLYARIHHLNAILANLFEASVDVVKRLFIRVFIDKQTIQ